MQLSRRHVLRCSDVRQNVLVNLVAQLGREVHEHDRRSSVSLFEGSREPATFLLVSLVQCLGVCLCAGELDRDVPFREKFVQLFERALTVVGETHAACGGLVWGCLGGWRVLVVVEGLRRYLFVDAGGSEKQM